MDSELTEKPQMELTETATFSPGAHLRQARESLGLTEDEVAIQLHLSKNVIMALESEDYQKLAGATFVRGYLRAYAKLLNVPSEEHIAAFNKLFPYTKEITPFMGRKHQKIVIKPKRHNENYVQWVGYGIIGILTILVFIWWHNRSAQQDEIVSTEPTTTALPAIIPDAKPTEMTTATTSTTPAGSTTATDTTIAGTTAGSLSATEMAAANAAAAADQTTAATSTTTPAGTTPDNATTPTTDGATMDASATNINATGSTSATDATTSTSAPASVKKPKKARTSAWHNPDH